MHVSVNTDKPYVGHLYAKLGAHRRPEAVIQVRDLRLSTPSAR